jgi:cysteine synthase A
VTDLEGKLKNLEGKIGNTPIVKVGEVYAKLEGKNPAGSVKDRAGFSIVRDALKRGVLKEGGTVVEATSGNTGIGIAYTTSSLNLRFVAVMPDNMSVERIALMKKYGAEVVLTPAVHGMGGAVQKATEIAEGGAYLAGQFSNPMSIDAHVKTTAPEIFRDLEKVDYIVCGVGSGGTAMGLKRYILENNLMTKVIGVEPEESPLLTKGWSGAHLIQGIGANFVPSILDCTMLDDIRTVEGQKALEAVREIYALSGEKCGISSGAAYVVAKEIKAENPSKTVLAIFPDGGDRYDNSLCE